MDEVVRKPCYNGYEEKFLTGKELKEMYTDCYYATGRHHSTVVSLPIAELLMCCGIVDDKQYRIFHNEAFCRVMRYETDGEIVFFGHEKLTDIDTLNIANFEMASHICKVCGAPMKLRTSKFGEFLGCSKYPQCKNTTHLFVLQNEYQTAMKYRSK